MRFLERDVPQTVLISRDQEFSNGCVFKMRKKHDLRPLRNDHAGHVGNAARNILQFAFQDLNGLEKEFRIRFSLW